MVLGFILNRLNVCVTGMEASLQAGYFPSWMEITGSIALVTLGVLCFRWIVNRMPVLRVAPEYRNHE